MTDRMSSEPSGPARAEGSAGARRDLARLLDGVELKHCVAIAIVLRLLWIALCPNQPTSDQVIYESSAREIAGGRGYVDHLGVPQNYWPVGYSALLGVWYALVGTSFPAAFFLNLGLWALGTAAAFWMTEPLYGRRAGVLCALIFALHPTFVLHVTLFSSENAFIPGSLLCCAIVVQNSDRMGPFARSLLFGLLVGLLAYVRPTGLTLLAGLPFLLWTLARWAWPRIALATGVAALAAVLLLVPWGLRNERHFGAFALTSQNGGANLWMGNNAESNGFYMPLPPDVAGMQVAARDALLRERAVRYIERDPLRYVAVSLRRLVRSLATDTSAVVWNERGIEARLGTALLSPLKALCTLAHWGLLGLALSAAAVHLKRRQRPDLPIMVLIALGAVPFALIVGGNRYMLPMMAFVAVLAASVLRTQGAARA